MEEKREKVNSYRDLVVWQKSIAMVVSIYTLTSNFPREEIYGLTFQMRRAAVSLPSNIAEGKYRKAKKEYIQFLRIAYASGAELETQLEISKQLSYGHPADIDQSEALLIGVMKMLHVMLYRLETRE
jgi:four helix bundle protein